MPKRKKRKKQKQDTKNLEPKKEEKKPEEKPLTRKELLNLLGIQQPGPSTPGSPQPINQDPQIAAPGPQTGPIQTNDQQPRPIAQPQTAAAAAPQQQVQQTAMQQIPQQQFPQQQIPQQKLTPAQEKKIIADIMVKLHKSIIILSVMFFTIPIITAFVAIIEPTISMVIILIAIMYPALCFYKSKQMQQYLTYKYQLKPSTMFFKQQPQQKTRRSDIF